MQKPSNLSKRGRDYPARKGEVSWHHCGQQAELETTHPKPAPEVSSWPAPLWKPSHCTLLEIALPEFHNLPA